MKRIFLVFLTILSITLSASAQDTAQAKFYISVGAALWDHFSINDNVVKNGGNAFSLFSPELGIGVVVAHKNIQSNLGISGIFPKKKSGNLPYKFQYGNINLGIRYKVLKFSERIIYAGGNLNYMAASLDLYPKNNTIDFDNIDPSKQVGMVHLNNRNFLLGPSLATGNLFPKSKFSINVIVSYEFNIIHGKWKSKYVDVIHSPVEDAGKFDISLLFSVL